MFVMAMIIASSRFSVFDEIRQKCSVPPPKHLTPRYFSVTKPPASKSGSFISPASANRA